MGWPHILVISVIMRGRQEICHRAPPSVFSEIMVTFFIVVILVYVLIIVILVFVDSLLLIGVIIMAQAAHVVITRLPFLSKSILSLAHLVMVGTAKHSILVFAVIVEYLLLLSLLLFFLECLDDLGLLLPSLLILQIVHIKLMLKVIDVGVLLNVNVVVSFEFGFQTLILFLIFWFNIF